ncbi:MAG: hypothetical protein WC726_02360 [Parcubacteria group bacterium]|jgi:hypothetical protein
MSEKSLEGFPEQFSENIKDADKQADFEKEQEADYLQLSKDCGIAAYAELTHKVPAHIVENLKDRRGSFIIGNLSNRAMYYGTCNHQAEGYITAPQDYIREFRKHMQYLQKKSEKAPSVTPEDMKIIKEQAYSYDEQGNPRFLNERNWTRHVFGNFKEVYSELTQRVGRTLEGFGEAAQAAGDEETYALIQKTLDEIKK